MSITSAKDWERERAALLNNALVEALRLTDVEGRKIKHALAEARKLVQGKILPGDKFLRCSEASMRRFWDDWNRGGRTADALLHDYSGSKVKMPGELVREFQRRATKEGSLNISAAIQSLYRDWKVGNVDLPGLGSREEWNRLHGLPLDAPTDFPVSVRTLYRWKPGKGELAGGVHGQARMRAVGPYVDMNYSTLRKGELYTLDDVRLDILCVDENSGKVIEVTCYMLMEVASRYLVAYVLKPRNAISQDDVDELLAYGLQAPGFGIGVGYTTHIKFERGTIACSKAAQLTLEAASHGRIKIHRTSMDGSIRWAGSPKDKASGHAVGKAVIESFFRRLHLALMQLPGQRGNKWANQPQNLGYEGAGKLTPGSLSAEAEKLARLQMIAGKRIALRLPMLYLRDVDAAVKEALRMHNTEPGHDYSGHGTFEQAEVAPGVWQETIV